MTYTHQITYGNRLYDFNVEQFDDDAWTWRGVPEQYDAELRPFCHESKEPFETQSEAVADMLRWFQQRMEDQREHRKQHEDDRIYGTYEQQARAAYEAAIRS